MKELDELIRMATAAKEDAVKVFEKKNHAAGVRLRKAMQDVKNQASIVRQLSKEI